MSPTKNIVLNDLQFNLVTKWLTKTVTKHEIRKFWACNKLFCVIKINKWDYLYNSESKFARREKVSSYSFS